MRAVYLIMAIFATGLFVTGYLGVYYGILSANGASSNNTYSKMNDTSSMLENLYDMYNITESSQNQTAADSSSAADAPLNLVSGVYNAVIYVFRIPMFFINLTGDLTGDITGWPSWASDMIAAMILTIVFAVLIYLISGRQF